MKHSFFHWLYRIVWGFGLLFFSCAIPHGFPLGTMIATEHGLIPIERLSTGTQVIGCNHANSVSAIGLCRPEYFIRISYGTQSEVISSPEQQFYCTNKEEWIHAHELCVDDQVATAEGGSVTIEAVERIPARGPTVIVSVEPEHTFYCTPDKLLTHNVVVVIPIVTYVFGEGAVWFGGATAATILVAAAKYVVYTIAEKMGCDVDNVSVTLADHSSIPEAAIPDPAGVTSAQSLLPASSFDISEYEASFSVPAKIEHNRCVNSALHVHSYQPESDIAAYLKTQPRPVQGRTSCGEPDMPEWIPPQLPVTNGILEDQPVRPCGTAALAQPKEPRACGSSVDDVTWERLHKKGHDTSFHDAVKRGKEALQEQLKGCNYFKYRFCGPLKKPVVKPIESDTDTATSDQENTEADLDLEPEEASLLLPEVDTDSDREITEPSGSAGIEQMLRGGPASTAYEGTTTPPQYPPLPLPTVDITFDVHDADLKAHELDEESAEYKHHFEKALEYATKENKLHHYFPAKHLFEELFNIPESNKKNEIQIQTEFVKRIIKELLKSLDLPLEGEKKYIRIVLDGIPIETVIIMYEGTIKIGTMYIPPELLPEKIINSIPQSVIDSLPKSVKKRLKR